MAQGFTGLGQSSASDGVFEGRIERTSSTVLTLGRYKGQRIEIDGDVQIIPVGGIACTIGASGSDTITSTGANSGSKTTTSTLYYVYVSSTNASPNPNSLRVSTQTPTLYNGIKYLGTSGNSAEWRFVGWIRTDASGNLADSDTQRFVINYYNKRRLRLFSSPAYSDNNAATTYTLSATSWAAANGGTGSKLEFVANGEDVVDAFVQGSASHSSAAGDVNFGLGISTTTSATVSEHTDGAAGSIINAKVPYFWTPAEGYVDVNLIVVTSGATMTVNADLARSGSTADPYATYIQAIIYG